MTTIEKPELTNKATKHVDELGKLDWVKTVAERIEAFDLEGNWSPNFRMIVESGIRTAHRQGYNQAIGDAIAVMLHQPTNDLQGAIGSVKSLKRHSEKGVKY